MRIAYDAKRLFNNFTGLGNYSRTLLDGQLKNYPEDLHLLYTPKVRATEQTQPYIRRNRCRVVRPGALFPRGFWRTFGLAGRAAKDRVDLFHGLSHELPIGLVRRRIPSVVTMHDVAWHTFPQMYHAIDRRIYDLKARYACRYATRIVAISESTKRDVMQYYGIGEEKISVVYQPAQPLFYHPPTPEIARRIARVAVEDLPQDYLLYVGAINSRKNLLGLVKAVEQLSAADRLPLLIVGRGREYEVEVRKYVAEHHLDAIIRFLPHIRNNEDLQVLYCCARAFVYPSFYEGFGLPVVEAMLSSCPVVTTSVSSLPEAGGPAALYVAPDSVEELTAALQVVVNDESRRRTMVTRGLEHAQTTFSPDALARRMHDLYEEVITGRL